MPQRIQKHRRVTLYSSAHPKREQDQTKNLAMAWINYKKAYVIVPQRWIINCLRMYKISDKVINFIEKTMKSSRVELTAGERKIIEHEGDSYSNHDWCFWYSHQRIIKGTGGLGNRRTNGDHPNYNIIENGQNTEKSHGHLRRLAVTQTPVKNHQLKLIWKTLKE